MKYFKYLALAVTIVIAEYLFLRGIWAFPQYISFGFFRVHFYSIFLLSAFFIVARLYDKYSKQDGELKKVTIDDALLWTLIPAIVLARIWHVATDFHLYSDNLLTALAIWNGGLSIFGGLLGGLGGIYLYAQKNKINFIKAVDLLAIFMPLGQVIGRYGNLANQELYGGQTNLPWGVYIRSEDNYFHPSFLYEQLGNLALHFLLYTLYKKQRFKIGSGTFTALYFLGYGMVRFVVDFFRTDPDIIWMLSVGQIVSLTFMLTALLYLIKRHVSPTRAYQR